MTIASLERERTLASQLLSIQAVTLRPQQPFTWSSGIRSPIYCDNRLTMSYPGIRAMITEGFVSLIQKYASDAEVIVGTATAGIPHAAWVADRLSLPMAYIRAQAKGHGKHNQIEGIIHPEQKVIVIEDLISTGGSSLQAAQVVKEAGADPLAVCAIFSYQLEQAVVAFAEANIPLYTLTNYSVLIDRALELAIIHPSDLDELKAWCRNPINWGKCQDTDPVGGRKY